jgi:hypothetical protein
MGGMALVADLPSLPSLPDSPPSLLPRSPPTLPAPASALAPPRLFQGGLHTAQQDHAQPHLHSRPQLRAAQGGLSKGCQRAGPCSELRCCLAASWGWQGDAWQPNFSAHLPSTPRIRVSMRNPPPNANFHARGMFPAAACCRCWVTTWTRRAPSCCQTACASTSPTTVRGGDSARRLAAVGGDSGRRQWAATVGGGDSGRRQWAAAVGGGSGWPLWAPVVGGSLCAPLSKTNHACIVAEAHSGVAAQRD